MDLFKNVSEYWEELFPVTENQKKFYSSIAQKFQTPVKYLRIGCGTGSFELFLSKDGADVTGIEQSQELLASANRKRRTMLMSIRFFQMTTLEMSRYLGKGFYNIISILDDRLMFIHDPTLLSKFFYDCRQLLAPEGRLVLSLPNFNKTLEEDESGENLLPVRESIRVKLVSRIKRRNDGLLELNQKIETGSGKILPVTNEALVQKIKPVQIEELAKKNGFESVEFFSDFEKTPLTADSDYVVAVLS